VTSSGRLVQIATIVSPINVSETQKERAIAVADHTRSSDQRASPIIPPIIYIIDFTIDISFTFSEKRCVSCFEIPKV
jgi:hypothetical protein